MMKKIVILSITAALSASVATAAVITPVSATASSVKLTSTATSLIDGSGLFTDAAETTPDNSLTGIHFDDGFTRSWVWNDGSGNPVISGEFVSFDLGGSYDVTDAYVWQTTYDTTGRQTRTFDIEYSTNGTDWFVASADEQLGQVTTLSNGSTAETFNFTSVTASFMRIGIDGTYERPAGDTNWLGGLGEVRFEGTVVPEPSSFALLAGMFGLTWVMLRRRA